MQTPDDSSTPESPLDAVLEEYRQAWLEGKRPDLADGGDPKVTDFGLAKIEDALHLSRTGDFAGTPYYISPGKP